ncbi:metallophosphoesterase [Sorangium sp. So ce1014]|uniref:metallophosphoesterase family protein n=1 Tax=Sorangium sp. So ce1014 TaxID=3133326 RepID=UPI003F63EC2D
MSIDATIDCIHYPTLGCPALLTPASPLTVWLSLPEGDDPSSVKVALVDRHGSTPEQPLTPASAPVALGLGPASPKRKRRTLWQIDLDLSSVRPALYDLAVRSTASETQPNAVTASETQPNAVRVYAEITGDEKVVFCGDSQYHVDNAACLERFITAINARDDIAWVALIGDGCDNGVKSKLNMLKLVVRARPGPVHSYYIAEFGDLAKRLLPRLNKPLVLVPGNHDGMAAYASYAEGTPSEAYLEPDPANEVAYDGIHHFRRTIGPLYFAFDWGKTRYICMNSFELTRAERLGYHAVVANWGGFVRAEQRGWLEDELEDASAAHRHAVVFMHHDPRGGSEGAALGYYSDVRPYRYDNLVDIAIAYARYVGSNASTWQQEWMKRPNDPGHLEETRKLLSVLLDHQVHCLIMGHDNENWVESYGKGADIFSEIRALQTYSSSVPPGQPVPPPSEVKTAKQLLKARQVDTLVNVIESSADARGLDGAERTAHAEAVLEAAFEELTAEGAFDPEDSFAPVEINRWKLRAKAPIHFIHVDDVGAYKHSRESHFAVYGYVVAQLHEGRPIGLQRYNVLGEANDPVSLLVV